jgi:hypothetical protein
MRLSPLFASVLLISLVPRPATAAAKVDARERAAKKACLTGDVTKGVKLLADLFIDTSDPTYIYNQGRCFEQNDRCEDAISKFREYLRKASKANLADKLDAEKHITDCQALLGKKETEAVQPLPPPLTAPPPEVPKMVVPEPNPPEQAKPGSSKPDRVETKVIESAKPSSAGSGLRTVGVVAVATGAVALAAGVGLNLKHNSMISDLQKGYDPDRDSSATTYRTLTLVGYGVGAACMVGGAILYYFGWQAGRVTVAPAPVVGLGGALVIGGAL